MNKSFILLFITLTSVIYLFWSFSYHTRSNFEAKISTEVMQTLAESKSFEVKFLDQAKLKLSDTQTILFKEFLFNDKHYFFDRHKKCRFIPEVDFVSSEEPSVHIWISSYSNQLKIEYDSISVLLDYDPMAISFNQFIQNCKEPLK